MSVSQKRKRPTIVRTDAHKKKKLAKNWRRPRGLHNKRRLRRKGYAPVLKKGFQSARTEKGRINGLLPVIVNKISELQSIDKKTQGIIIFGGTGLKNKLGILEESKKIGIKILNFDADKKIKELKDLFEQRRKKKETKEKEKEKKEEEKKKISKKEEEKKEDKKDDKTEEKSQDLEEDKKEQEKKELDKLLTKKQ